MIDSAAPGGATGTGGGSPSSGSAASPSAPSPSSGTSSPGGASPATGAQGTGSPASGTPRNPVPWERFEEVNTKYGKVSWAEKYEDAEEVEQATNLYRWFDRDPHGAYQYLTGLMERQGYTKPAAAPAAAAAQRDPLIGEGGKPLPDRIIQETGEQFYSASQAQKLVEWGMGQVGSRVEKLEALTGGMQARTQAQQEARSIIAEASKWEHFDEFAEDIWSAMEKDKRLSIEGAYRRVVVPKIRAKEREAVVTEMRTRAESGTANPGSPAPQSTIETRKLPMKELFRREMVKRGLGH